MTRAAGFLLALVPSHAFADPCASYKAPLEEFVKFDPERECGGLLDNVCADVYDIDENGQEKRGEPKVSVCRLAADQMRRAVEKYYQQVDQHCPKMLDKIRECAAKGAPGQRAYTECLRDVYRTSGAPEENMSRDMTVAQEIFRTRIRFQEQMQRIRQKFDADIAKIRTNSVTNADGGMPTGLECNKRHPPGQPRSTAPVDIPDGEVMGHLFGGGGFPTAMARMEDLVKKQQKFMQIAFGTADRHNTNVREYKRQATDLDKVARGLGSNQQPPGSRPDDKNKSDITGTDKQPQQAQQSPGGGQKGGGEGGGGSPSGGGQPQGGPSQGAAGPTAPTPDSMNPGSNKPRTPSEKVGKNNDGGSKTGKGESPIGKLGNAGGLGGLNNFGGLSASSAPGLTTPFTGGHGGMGGGRTSASSGSAGGGGGGAGGGDLGSGNIGGKHCVGKDCATSNSSQFAPVGSLGGGGGLGDLGGLPPPLDGGGSLDSLFKNENKAAPGADGLAGLDAGGAPLDGGGAGAIDPVNGSEEAGVAGINGENLFVRAHHTYEQAQKQGRIVGMAKKL